MYSILKKYIFEKVRKEQKLYVIISQFNRIDNYVIYTILAFKKIWNYILIIFSIHARKWRLFLCHRDDYNMIVFISTGKSTLNFIFNKKYHNLRRRLENQNIREYEFLILSHLFLPYFISNRKEDIVFLSSGKWPYYHRKWHLKSCDFRASMEKIFYIPWEEHVFLPFGNPTVIITQLKILYNSPLKSGLIFSLCLNFKTIILY